MNSEGATLLKLIAALAIDYLRWAALAPLVTLWAFGIGMLAAMLFINYEAQSWDALDSLFQWIAGLPMIGDRFVAWLESLAGEDGTIQLGGNELRAAMLKAWSLLSLAFMILALAVNWAFGPFKPWPLTRKLAIAALCSLALLAGLVAVYFVRPEPFNGPAGQWMLIFSSISLVLLVASASCLTFAHVLGLARRAVNESSLGAGQRSTPLPASERSYNLD